MDPDFWHARWRENRLGFHLDEVNPRLLAHWSRLAGGHEVFVPLCGKSVDLRWLHDQGHRVLGVELSELAVRAFFDEQGLPAEVREAGSFKLYRHAGIRVLCGDFFDLRPSDLAAVGAVYDRASLIAFPPETRVRYAAHLRRCLPPAAPVLLVTLDYPQAEMNGPPFSVSDEEVAALFGGDYAVERVETHDVLAEHPQFRAKGLSRLAETIWLLQAADRNQT